ncbi:MAG: nucleotidyl transferase AbiEii/AbiGii toxin family protein [Candidatus Omnitrophota bacterium]|nr:nucleotidyl transferase AbiEii/AbiGii toxin family protein [Candidatus Omnitrophota bacterium]
MEYQEKALKNLSGKLKGFYLSGGTALSLYYFHHRQSLDLDFFSPHFEKSVISGIIKGLAEGLKQKIELVAEQNKKDRVRIEVYMVRFGKNEQLKIDFVEDFLKTIKPAKVVNGIPVLSLEDIYLRKIYAVTGTMEAVDDIGRKKTIGGRQEAKDFYDIYCLSSIFMPLSKFADKYCDAVRKEGLVRWFRTYDRLSIKSGLLELEINKEADYRLMEKHFKREIDKLLEKEVGL